MNKILYQPTEGTSGFFLVTEVPESPVAISTSSLTVFNKEMSTYREALESCKANKQEIVNPEDAIEIGPDFNTLKWQSRPLQSGDLFDIPVGYEAKKQVICCDNSCYDGKCLECNHLKVVLRLVKTVTHPETQGVKNETKEQENVPDNKSTETRIIPEPDISFKQHFNAVANLAHRCIQFEDGEMQGFNMVMFESLLPIILKPVMKVPQPEPEAVSLSLHPEPTIESLTRDLNEAMYHFSDLKKKYLDLKNAPKAEPVENQRKVTNALNAINFLNRYAHGVINGKSEELLEFDLLNAQTHLEYFFTIQRNKQMTPEEAWEEQLNNLTHRKR